MKHLKKFGIILLALTVLLCAAVGIYAADYYHMEEAAVTALLNMGEGWISDMTGKALA